MFGLSNTQPYRKGELGRNRAYNAGRRVKQVVELEYAAMRGSSVIRAGEVLRSRPLNVVFPVPTSSVKHRLP